MVTANEEKLEKVQEKKEDEGNKLLSKKMLGTLLAKARRNKEHALYATLGAVIENKLENFNFYILFDSPSYFAEATKENNKLILENYLKEDFPEYNLNIKLIEKQDIKIDYLTLFKKEFRTKLIIKNKKGVRRNV